MRGIAVISIGICLVFLSGAAGFTQPLPMDTLWFNLYGYEGPGFDSGRAIIETAEGDIVIGGIVRNLVIGDYNPYVVKTSSNGDSIWSREYIYPDYDCNFQEIAATEDGGFTYAFVHSTHSLYDSYNLEHADSSGHIVWNQFRMMSGSYISIGDMKRNSDGGYCIFGDSENDVYIAKHDSAGQFEWDQYYHNSQSDNAEAGMETSDGCFVIAGRTNFSPGTQRGLALKVDSEGNLMWMIDVTDQMSSVLYDVIELENGNYIFGGRSENAGYRLFLFCTDPDGVVLWESVSSETGIECLFLDCDHDDGFICGYNSFQSGTDYEFCYIKTDKYGRIVLSYEWDTEFYDSPNAMMLTSDGCLAATGRYYSVYPDPEFDDIFVLKTGPVPTVITVELPDTSVNNGESVWISVTCSNISEEDSVLSFQMIINYDAEIGYIDSAKIEGCLTPDHFTSVWNFSQPGIVNGGYLNFFNFEGITGGGTLCYLKFTGISYTGNYTELEFEACIFNGGEPSSSLYDGSVEVLGVGVEEQGVEKVPDGFALHPVYPNPFNMSTTVEYSIPAEAHVSLEVFDTSGRLVKRIFSGTIVAGEYTERIEFDNTAAGLYFIRLKSSSYQEVKKLILIK